MIFVKPNGPTNTELERIIKDYDALTKGLSNEWAMDKLDTPGKSHWVALLKISDFYHPTGGAKAILIAFKLGYMFGKGMIELGRKGGTL